MRLLRDQLGNTRLLARLEGFTQRLAGQVAIHQQNIAQYIVGKQGRDIEQRLVRHTLAAQAHEHNVLGLRLLRVALEPLCQIADCPRPDRIAQGAANLALDVRRPAAGQGRRRLRLRQCRRDAEFRLAALRRRQRKRRLNLNLR